MQKIIFIHSLNNYTGSPNILALVIRGLIQRGFEAEVMTSSGDGFLSNIVGIKYSYTFYHWCDSPLKTMILLLVSQMEMFMRCCFGSRDHLYYINTIIPFGAVIACWLTRKKYIIHVHENMRQRKPLYLFLKGVYLLCNQKSIFVSDYLAKQAMNCKDGVVIANALPDSFFKIASQQKCQGKNVLMVSSLRRFKGIYEFAELARLLPQYSFELVLSAKRDEVECFKTKIGEITNLTVYDSQTNIHLFYQRAAILLQLSNPNDWIETFGLTILEAMAYGIPAIVPNAGGPAELVENGVNGYTVNPLDLSAVRSNVETLMSDKELYRQFSERAKKKSEQYTQTKMITQIETYIK